MLILAGTTEATRLAEVLDDDGVVVTSSLAGITADPVPRPGRVRRGGFGGAEGLAEFLVREGVDALVDATHPFAASMPFHAAAACEAAGVPLCRLLREAWTPTAGDRWIEVDDLEQAADALDHAGAQRVFLAVGRQSLAPFQRCAAQSFVVRSIEPPLAALHDMTSILERGPFDVEGERTLLETQAIDTLVTKNAGGGATVAKLTAARELGVTVVMVHRPPQPVGAHRVASVEAAAAWVRAVVRLPSGHGSRPAPAPASPPG